MDVAYSILQDKAANNGQGRRQDPFHHWLGHLIGLACGESKTGGKSGARVGRLLAGLVACPHIQKLAMPYRLQTYPQ